MDSRHESLEQEILNELIDLINLYVRDNIDDVLMDQRLDSDIKKVARYVYNYARIYIDLDSMFSKKNLLSIDVVALPRIDELVVVEIDSDKLSFAETVDGIRSVVVDHYPETVCGQQFYMRVREILNKDQKVMI